MNPVRRRKFTLVLFILSVLGIVTGLVLYTLRQNISLFYTPSQVAQGEAPKERLIRLGGMVVKNSILRQEKNLSVEFQLTDFNQVVTVRYRGILPDLFREGQGIVALGTLTDNHHFKAQEVLAKHDANYMPPEVKEALAKSGKLGEKKSG
ncbi:cytochrome c maturation protein CcmE [Legionella jamestowniensis]|uniref:Cytochrome c-type biogenesis protein CcmE n=1 Tax=Legionella jamestowniensis TaxID=455 RepID=A0A0W0UGC9_9GAMM|nr:cytochrome c maturation protein CcmE [Legionella jamestowniensis]KTD06727.1 cytochrome c-type biogenesis protein CcmE [Legionella jamestowniensis]OCH97394.1 cytochrome c biogenesis protein CcmE [Legionella jamestowniensis]SFL84101.1 cytochrome c-type biogenesis protein CcmE [Legionella jamestowniensis DSM 19215]